MVRKQLYVYLFSLLSLTACSCKTLPGGSHNAAATAPTLPQETVHIPGSAIVLFHGFQDHVSELDNIKSELTQTFPATRVVAFQRDETQPIAAQAYATYQDLQAAGLAYKSLVFLGISAGGVVAIETYDRCAYQTDIKGIIAYHSPLEGAPCISAMRRMLPPGTPAAYLPSPYQEIANLIQCKTICDLNPQNNFVYAFKSKLNRVSVPILTVASRLCHHSHIRDTGIGKLVESIAAQQSQNPDIILDGLVGHVVHDGLIPLESQIANGSPNTMITPFIESEIHHFRDPSPQAMQVIKQAIRNYFGA
ncbi:MAG: alpha/beta hydrolase [Bacteroidota bacterium]